MTDTASESPFWEQHKRTLFIVALFVTVFVAARLAIRPINSVDYGVYVRAVQAFWNGQSPFTVQGYYYPPWSIFFIAPLANQPLETWLALSVALFAASVIDQGRPAGLLLLLSPIFITLLASSNAEWLWVGPGLWLLYRAPKGWTRGLAWLLLSCKPQTTVFLLLVDGWDALRSRDWRAFGLAAAAAIVTWALYPQFLTQLAVRLDINWSASVVYRYGILVAALTTALILLIRRRQLGDRKTLGLLLGPVLSPFILEYGCTAMLFTLRGAGWWRNALYLAASIGLVALFWRDYHTAEQAGILGMVLLAAVLAPAYPQEPVRPPETP